MKKYMSPAMEIMGFDVDESVAFDIGSIFNEDEFGSW